MIIHFPFDFFPANLLIYFYTWLIQKPEFNHLNFDCVVFENNIGYEADFNLRSSLTTLFKRTKTICFQNFTIENVLINLVKHAITDSGEDCLIQAFKITDVTTHNHETLAALTDCALTFGNYSSQITLDDTGYKLTSIIENSGLHTLTIKQTQLTSEKIADALSIMPDQPKCLRLYDNAFHAGITVSHKNITRLEICGTRISVSMLSAFKDLLEKLPNLEHLVLNNLTFQYKKTKANFLSSVTNHKQIKHLSLENAELEDEDIQNHISPYLGNSKCLESLNLKSNRITATGWKELILMIDNSNLILTSVTADFSDPSLFQVLERNRQARELQTQKENLETYLTTIPASIDYFELMENYKKSQHLYKQHYPNQTEAQKLCQRYLQFIYVVLDNKESFIENDLEHTELILQKLKIILDLILVLPNDKQPAIINKYLEVTVNQLISNGKILPSIDKFIFNSLLTIKDISHVELESACRICFRLIGILHSEEDFFGHVDFQIKEATDLINKLPKAIQATIKKQLIQQLTTNINHQTPTDKILIMRKVLNLTSQYPDIEATEICNRFLIDSIIELAKNYNTYTKALSEMLSLVFPRLQRGLLTAELCSNAVFELCNSYLQNKERILKSIKITSDAIEANLIKMSKEILIKNRTTDSKLYEFLIGFFDLKVANLTEHEITIESLHTIKTDLLELIRLLPANYQNYPKVSELLIVLLKKNVNWLIKYGLKTTQQTDDSVKSLQKNSELANNLAEFQNTLGDWLGSLGFFTKHFHLPNFIEEIKKLQEFIASAIKLTNHLSSSTSSSSSTYTKPEINFGSSASQSLSLNSTTKKYTFITNLLEKLKFDIDLVTVESDLICPISHEIMKDPVTASDGYTYDRDSIQAYINLNIDNPISPTTRQPISIQLYPSLSHRDRIRHLLEGKIKEQEQIIESFDSVPVPSESLPASAPLLTQAESELLPQQTNQNFWKPALSVSDSSASVATSSIQTETDNFTGQFPSAPSHPINPSAKYQESQVSEKKAPASPNSSI